MIKKLFENNEDYYNLVYKVANFGLVVLSKIKLFHWFVESGFKHTKLDEFYQTFYDLNDKLMESLLGYTNVNLEEVEFEFEWESDELYEFIDDIIQVYTEIKMSINEDSINNILDEIIALFMQNKYILKRN